MNVSETPIYDQTLNEVIGNALEDGDEELFDTLERMDSDTQPGNPVLAAAHEMEA